MTRTGLSEEAMRQSLLDIRLPAGDLNATLADLLMTAGLGGVAALVALGLIQLVTRRRRIPVEVTLKDRITALQGLPDDTRRIGFLHLLREIAPDRYAELRQTLYLPDPAFDPESEVLARV